MRNLALILFIHFVIISCQSSTETNLEYDSTLSEFTIDRSVNYNQVLKSALNLDQVTADRVKKILANYRENRKKQPEREVKLRKNREQKLTRVLTPVQMKQRKYVNALYYESLPDYPTHPANIQKEYNLTNGQVLKLIEIEERHKVEKKLDLRKKRILEVLGNDIANKYLESKGLAF